MLSLRTSARSARTAVRGLARLNSIHGFTLLDLLVVLGLVSILSAIGIPLLNTTTTRLKLGQAARDVERELQGAKQRAVSSNRPVRVRFNCPEAGAYRAVELIGTPSVPHTIDSDTSLTRCGDTAYPYPAADRDPITLPNIDGQLRRLPREIAFGDVKTIEFRPNGTAHAEQGGGAPWPTIATTGLTLTLTHESRTASIQVNGLGRITIATTQ